MDPQRDVDGYLAAAPEAVRPLLAQLRQAIRKAAPEAEESISYGMPSYAHRGRLVYFAAWKKHVALYAAIPGEGAYAEELQPYLGAKSTLRFPVNEPLPVALIEKVVRTRVRENEARSRR